MSACLSSGGAAYSFELEKVKSPPSSSTTTIATTSSHNTPSPSSTLSESNSPLAISTRKQRTPRKRPNQTYNEAVALLSTAYPNIFSTSTSPSSSATAKKTQSNSQFFGMIKSPLSESDDASELLLPFESIEEPDFLFNPTIQTKPDLLFEQKEVNSGGNNGGGGGDEIDELKVNRFELFEEFDAESILDEEIEEGIDSIMGCVELKTGENLGTDESRAPGINRGGNSHRIGRLEQMMMMNSLSRSSKGFGFAGNLHLGLGLRSALRENDEANWWRFPTVNVEQISPRIQTATTSTGEEKSVAETKPMGSTGEKSNNKKKKKKKLAALTPLSLAAAESKISESSKEDTDSSLKTEKRSGPLLKLDYDGVLDAWSDKASPFSDEILGSEAAGADVHARLGQIDLFGENGMREASVLRYKEKRRTRLFSKKIRYQVRKLNADQRPRMKGRFVRRPNASNPSGQRS